MRLMSFALTTEAFRRREKRVTRRLGWRTVQPGTLLMGVEKAQGLKKGESPVRLGVIRVISRRQEQLSRMLTAEYGAVECCLEGFPDLTPEQFVVMFCGHNGCPPSQVVTRIEFEYVDEVAS